MVKLCARNVSLTVQGAGLVKEASFAMRPGELIALIGPNGAGKSSLLRCLVGLEHAQSGAITLDERDIASLSSTNRARLVGYLPQQRPLAWPLMVADTVALGRYAYGATPGRLSPQDVAAVTAAMDEVGITPLAFRRTDSLSGGELARVHIARLFSGHTPLLLADEPLAALDPKHQWQVMELLRTYVAQGGGALVVIHDLVLAAHFADRIIWMDAGRIVADGTPAETMTSSRIAEVYGVAAEVTNNIPQISGLI